MEHIPSNDILQMGLSWLKSHGERMHYSSNLLHAYRSFNMSILVLNLIFIVANLGHIQGAKYIRLIEGASTASHGLVKYTLFLYYKSDIEKLLDDVYLFWNCESSYGNIFRNTQRIFRNIKIMQLYYLATGISCITMFFLKPLFSRNNTFMFECWTFSHSLLMETIILSCQYYFWIIMFPIVFAYDCLYLAYCVHVIIQLRLLKSKFKCMLDKISVEEINSYIRHHQMLLSIFNRMKKVYFWMLLFHYFVTLITGCSQLYVILLGNTDRGDLIATVIYISGLFIQFAYYSFPVEEIVFELTDLSNAIYMSTWFDRSKEIKRLLLFIMTKAQRQKYLSAGGIMDINVNAFGSVIRKSFSFYAILKNVINK